MILVPKMLRLAGDKYLLRASVAVNKLLRLLINNTGTRLVKMCHHVLIPPILHMPLLEKGIIELRNGNICVIHNLSDLLMAPPRDDLVEADRGAFLGVYGVFKKEAPDRVANITSHN